MEFKGTKGKWERVLLETTDFCQRRNEIHYGKDGECVAEYVHNDYDALLISKAPEMLEMLKDIIRQANEVVYVNSMGASETYFQLIGQAENLIKESTEI
jgi:hypothetical protein